MYKHIIWDFDGTLFDTYPVMGNIFKDMLKEQGHDESLSEILKHMKISMPHTIEYYKEKYKINADFLKEYKLKRKALEIELCKPFPGVETICKYIHSLNKKNYLYTHRGKSAIELLKKFQLEIYFTECVTLQNDFKRKPDPEAINYLVDKYGLMKSEVIMIGDREIDILAAKNAEISTCFFYEGKEKIIDCDFVIHKIEELYEIINHN